MTQIRLENITKSFGRNTIIPGLSLTINDGEFFTFVGPSGCGKSTVLNMIAGLEPASVGSIFFDAKLVNAVSPRDRDVAMVFQSYALYPHFTVYDNLAFPLRMQKIRANIIEDEVTRVARLLGLDDFLAKKPKELSGGQRQRVAFGRAIIRKPKVFLMDEPLSNLDARLRIEMRAELKRLHRELGITTIYVTHDQGEAMGLSDRIAVLNKGEIQQIDQPREVYANPANIFVAGFIGSPPMNFLKCKINKTKPLELNCNGTLFSPQIETEPEGNEVLLGIRPEDMAVERTRSDQGIEVYISVVEPAGPYNWVDIIWNDVKVRGMSDNAERILPGDRVFLTVPVKRTLVFDQKTGIRL